MIVQDMFGQTVEELMVSNDDLEVASYCMAS